MGAHKRKRIFKDYRGWEWELAEREERRLGNYIFNVYDQSGNVFLILEVDTGLAPTYVNSIQMRWPSGKYISPSHSLLTKEEAVLAYHDIAPFLFPERLVALLPENKRKLFEEIWYSLINSLELLEIGEDDGGWEVKRGGEVIGFTRELEGVEIEIKVWDGKEGIRGAVLVVRSGEEQGEIPFEWNRLVRSLYHLYLSHSKKS